MSFIHSVRQASTQYHRALAWLGACILFIYLLSALTHPILAWTGPKAAAFFPPRATVSVEHLRNLSGIISENTINQANVLKILPSKNEPVLQLTTIDENMAKTTSTIHRRYFDLTTGKEKKYYDKEHALWLAEYYMGREIPLDVRSIQLQTEFTQEYPWVNRLLPVYKIELNDKENTILYIYTELNALASMSNDWKKSLQIIFQSLHTWDFLGDIDNARVLLLALMMLTLTAFILSGIGLVFSFKSRKIKQSSCRWHRRIACIIWLPLLGFSTSGLYHLLQSAYGENTSGLRLNNAMILSEDSFSATLNIKSTLLNNSELTDVQRVSVISNNTGDIYYRISLPLPHSKQMHKKSDLKAVNKKTIDEDEYAHQHHKPVSREEKYKGKSAEKDALYFHAKTGKPAAITDKKLAQQIATVYLNASNDEINHISKVTHFGPNYDFRNKRLPVWRVDFDNSQGDIVFVDPETRIIVDHTTKTSRYERYSFSLLHKWNFLASLTGRKNRDIVIIAALLMSLGLTILGVILLLKKKNRKKAKT